MKKTGLTLMRYPVFFIIIYLRLTNFHLDNVKSTPSLAIPLL